MKKTALMCLALLIALVFATFKFSHKSEPGHVHGEGYAEWIAGPTSDPLSPADALKSFVIADGYTVANVAAEPLVQAPVVIQFDASGRMWVAEMTNYMLDISGKGQTDPEGNIVILSDSDGDGVMDKREEFLSNLVLPRAMAFVAGGLLFADNTALYYTPILGDKPGNVSVVDPNYAQGSNVEHKANGLLYGLDNWIYSAFGDWRYRVLPHDVATPQYASKIFATETFKIVRAKTERRGQWGITKDKWGRLFYNNNSTLLLTDRYPSNIQWQNPNFFWEGSTQKRLSENYVYPVRETAGVNRGYQDGILNEKGRLVKATAASGPVIYRGNTIHSLDGHAIIPEPTANLVTAVRLSYDEAGVSGDLFFRGASLLASSDERFRPVNTALGPDGGLYIVDMYRGIIQDRFYLTQYLSEYILGKKLDKGVDFGRVYRVSSQEGFLEQAVDLSEQTSAALVTALKSENGWVRDTAQRQLVERRDLDVSQQILELMLNQAVSADVRLVAFWTLEGMGQLTEVALLKAMGSGEYSLQQAALIVGAERQEPTQTALLDLMLSLGLEKTAHKELRFSIAANLGKYESPSALKTLASMVGDHGDSQVFMKVAFTGLENKEQAFSLLLETPQHQAIAEALLGAQKPVSEADLSHMTIIEKETYQRGKYQYSRDWGCAACHGIGGQGIEYAGPPLANSEWVNGDTQRLTAILLHGIEGPIEVNGQLYDPGMAMPGLLNNHEIGMNDVASLVAYIRNSWGNSGDFISIEEVHMVKAKTADRTEPYTVESLLADFPEKTK